MEGLSEKAVILEMLYERLHDAEIDEERARTRVCVIRDMISDVIDMRGSAAEG